MCTVIRDISFYVRKNDLQALLLAYKMIQLAFLGLLLICFSLLRIVYDLSLVANDYATAQHPISQIPQSVRLYVNSCRTHASGAACQIVCIILNEKHDDHNSQKNVASVG
jgi:hypothetical protein